MISVSFNYLEIKNLAPVTQLYLSVDAPSKTMLKAIDLPAFPDFWERLLQSLDHLAQKKQRTCIRLTLIKDVNMTGLEGYASLIARGNPDFIELKAYMWVGASQLRLKRENMPLHEDVLAFAKGLQHHLPEYELVTEHIPSRVVLMAKRKFKKQGIWHTWIDFEKYHASVCGGSDFTAEDYLKITPAVGFAEVHDDAYQEIGLDQDNKALDKA